MSLSDTASESEADISHESDERFWGRLPRKFRTDIGNAGGSLPPDEILGFKPLTGRDLSRACDVFEILAQRATRRLGTRLVSEEAGACGPSFAAFSGTSEVGPTPGCGPRLAGHGILVEKIFMSQTQSRSASPPQSASLRAVFLREAADLERWRGELAELITEARLPLSTQAQQCRDPQKLVAAALGGMRASTIKQRIREWRKLRAFCLGVAEVAWPPHLGIVLDYLQERVDEPCARTVPESVLAALKFMEKAGGVSVNERFSGQQVLKKL